MFDGLKDWWRKNSITRESLEQIGWMRPFAHRVLEPSLWRFNRRSVPRGVALGLLVGIFLLIPGIQIAGAALLALPCRANVPIAAAMTFLSNPATTPFILYASIYIGNRTFNLHADLGTITVMLDHSASLVDWLEWLASSAAPALLSGLFVISVVTAAIGYLIAALTWRAWISRKWSLRARYRNIRGA